MYDHCSDDHYTKIGHRVFVLSVKNSPPEFFGGAVVMPAHPGRLHRALPTPSGLPPAVRPVQDAFRTLAPYPRFSFK